MAKFEVFSGTVRDVTVYEGQIMVNMEGSLDGQEVFWTVTLLSPEAMAIEPGRAASLILETEAPAPAQDSLEKFFESLMGLLIQSMKLNKSASERALMELEDAQVEIKRSDHLTYITQQLRVLWAYSQSYLR